MAPPLSTTAGALVGTMAAYLRKAGMARPVATANRPPSAIHLWMASIFRRLMAGISPPERRASSVYSRVLSKSLASSIP